MTDCREYDLIRGSYPITVSVKILIHGNTFNPDGIQDSSVLKRNLVVVAYVSRQRGIGPDQYGAIYRGLVLIKINPFNMELILYVLIDMSCLKESSCVHVQAYDLAIHTVIGGHLNLFHRIVHGLGSEIDGLDILGQCREMNGLINGAPGRNPEITVQEIIHTFILCLLDPLAVNLNLTSGQADNPLVRTLTVFKQHYELIISIHDIK